MAARKGVADASPVVAGAAAEPYPALQQPTVRLDGTNDPPCVPFCAPAEARRRESEEFPTQRGPIDLRLLRRPQSRSPNAMKLPGVRNAAGKKWQLGIQSRGFKHGIGKFRSIVTSLLDPSVTERLAGVRISHVYHPTYATWPGSGGGRCWKRCACSHLPRILNIPQKCQNPAFFLNTIASWTGTEERTELKRTRVGEAPAGEPLVAVTVSPARLISVTSRSRDD